MTNDELKNRTKHFSLAVLNLIEQMPIPCRLGLL